MASSKNSELLEMFTAYCKRHPEERFWQALCNWSGYNILAQIIGGRSFDTFHLEGDWSKWPRE